MRIFMDKNGRVLDSAEVDWGTTYPPGTSLIVTYYENKAFITEWPIDLNKDSKCLWRKFA